MKELFVLDVSGFIFRAYFALPPMTNAKGEATHALYGFIRSVLKLLKDFSPEHIVAVFDGPDNKKSRKAIYTEYKSNRGPIQADLPEQIAQSKIFCTLFGIPTIELPGVEADDAMGSIATWAARHEIKTFLCTSDKDLAQLVTENVFLLNPWKENLILDRQKVVETYGVPPEHIVDLLALMGDASDNIPGVKGFGPKTAVELITQFGTLDNLLEQADAIKSEKKRATLLAQKEEALLSRRLATIHTDIPFPVDRTHFARLPPQEESLHAFYRENGFSSLLKESAPAVQEELAHYHLIDEEATLHTLLQTLHSAHEIAFEVVTTANHFLQGELVGLTLAHEEKNTYYIPLNGTLGRKKVLTLFKPLLEGKKCYTHDLKYALHHLKRCDIDLSNASFDTIIASYLLNSASRRHSLEELALHYFGRVKTPLKTLVGSGKKEIPLSHIPLKEMSAFFGESLHFIVRLKKLLDNELAKRGLATLYYELELPLLYVLAKMEWAGIYLDRNHLQKQATEIVKTLEGLESEIYTLAGEKFNLNSPKQLSVILFEKLNIKPLKKTATGLSTNVEVLEALAAEYPIAKKIMEYRVLEKLRSTYLEALPQCADPFTGRIHPTFIQWGTATGRLSCQDPNLQNIPVRTSEGKKIRSAFRPAQDNWSFLAADYSQIELRLLAHLSQDAQLIRAFKAGEDIHTFTASLVFNLPLEEVTKEMRHQAKAINFGIIYGQQAYGLSQELGIEVKKAASFIEAYFDRYPKVLEFVRDCIDFTQKNGKAVTMLGREREIPEILSHNINIRQAAERLAMNTPLQGSAADLIKKAMLDLDAAFAKEKFESFLVLQIHDELIFEVPDTELLSVAPLVKKVMEGVFPLEVPLVVDVVVGKNWGAC